MVASHLSCFLFCFQYKDRPEVKSSAPIDVNVIGHQMQRYAVWFGGSMLSMDTVCSILLCIPSCDTVSSVFTCSQGYAHFFFPSDVAYFVFVLFVWQGSFMKVCHTRAQYEEEGPRIARHNAVFSPE
jgi:actin-related protein 3